MLKLSLRGAWLLEAFFVLHMDLHMPLFAGQFGYLFKGIYRFRNDYGYGDNIPL